MLVNIKRLHENAVIPKYAKEGDAGLDLVATEILKDTPEQITYGTGLAVELPEGYVGLVFPRSSVRNTGLQLSNSVGVIDSGYRGEIQVTFNKIFDTEKIYDEVKILGNDNFYKTGDRVAQIIVMKQPYIVFSEVNELTETERGNGGFGSTGK